MRKLTKKIIDDILLLDNKRKEEVGNMLVLMFGGNPKKNVSKLKPRRGNSDGGIDGRIGIITEVEIIERERNDLEKQEYSREIKKKEKLAAFNIKLTKGDFTRNLLQGFKEDMNREKIFTGIIIANKLSRDAKDTLDIYCNENGLKIYFISLKDIIENNINCPIELSSNSTFEENIKNYLSSKP